MSVNNDCFDKKANRWREMKRRSPEAIMFYDKEIFPSVKELFLEKSEPLAKELKNKALIATLGFSPEPVALTLALIEPRYTLFLLTKETENQLERLFRLYQDIEPGGHKHVQVEAADAADVYGSIREFLTERELSPSECVADPTGGRKAMSAGMGIAAASLGIRCVYVDSVQDKGVPIPGTEKLVLLKNPLDVFGDLDRKVAVSHFKNRNYKAASDHFIQKAKQLSKPREFELLGKLSSSLDRLFSFKVEEARQLLKECTEMCRMFELCEDIRKRAEDAVELLETVEESDIGSVKGKTTGSDALIPYILFKLGQKHFEKAENDLAALMAYSALEKVFHSILIRDFGLNDESPNYGKLEEARISKEKVQRRYMDIIKIISKTNREAKKESSLLPEKLSFMNSFILLKALGSEAVEQIVPNKMFGISSARNKSILVHGTTPINKRESQSLIEIAEKVLCSFFPTCGESFSFERFEKALDFSETVN